MKRISRSFIRETVEIIVVYTFSFVSLVSQCHTHHTFFPVLVLIFGFVLFCLVTVIVFV